MTNCCCFFKAKRKSAVAPGPVKVAESKHLLEQRDRIPSNLYDRNRLAVIARIQNSERYRRDMVGQCGIL